MNLLTKRIWVCIAGLLIVGVVFALLMIGNATRRSVLIEDVHINMSEDEFLIDGEKVTEKRVRDMALAQREKGGFAHCYVVLDERVRFGRIREQLLPVLDVVFGDLLFSTTANTSGVLVIPHVCPISFVDAHIFSLLITKDDMRVLANTVEGPPITQAEINARRDTVKPLRIDFSVRDDVSAKRFYEVIRDLSSLTNSFLVWDPYVGNQPRVGGL